MTRSRPASLRAVASAAAILLLALAPVAGASSGSIAGLQRLSDGNLQATFTASFDQCSGSYCGWYPKATQVLGSESCSPSGSIVWSGSFQSTSGTQSATKSFSPTSKNRQVRVCLYGMQSGTATLLAQEVYTPALPPDQAIGSITDVKRTATGEVEATYSVTYSKCDANGSCGWYPTAHQVASSEPCSDSFRMTWVGEFQSGPGTLTGTKAFRPAFDGPVRLCLYVHGAGTPELITETLYTPPAGFATGSISGVSTSAGKVTATFEVTADLCAGHASCAWRPMAYEIEATRSCPATHDGHQVYAGTFEQGGASQSKTVTFTTRYPGERIRLCLYGHHYYSDGTIKRADELVAQTTLRTSKPSKPPAPPLPPDKPFTMGRAKKAVNEALWRRFGSAWFGRSNYQRSCRRITAHRVRCQVSWAYVRDTYRGRVTVWVVGRQWTTIHYSVRIMRRHPL